jgi:hypothetical protein
VSSRYARERIDRPGVRRPRTRRRASRRLRPAHPRRAGPPHRGSSPRVRGPILDRVEVQRRGRFIPARAGTASSRGLPTRSGTVHPRACGDRLFESVIAIIFRGSSPRVRGPQKREQLAALGHRFIPARAGTAYQDAAGVSLSNDSSPRVRGPHPAPARPLPRERFIPARAGTGCTRAGRPLARPVHPRACGDRALAVKFSFHASGSSPRVRRPRSTTILPAPLGTVHSRVCGYRSVVMIASI